MCIYLVAQVVMAIFVLLAYRANIKVQNRFIFLSCLMWTLIYGLRGYDVGNDTLGYAAFFDESIKYKSGYGSIERPNETMEWGFVLIASTLHLLSENATFLFMVNAAMMFSLVYFLYKNKRTGLWGLLCFFVMSQSFMTLIVALRQSFSIICVLISLYFLRKVKFPIKLKTVLAERNFWLGISLYIFSIFIHRSSILLIPMLVLVSLVHLNRRIVFVIVGITFFLSTMIPDSVGIIFDLALSHISGMSDDKVALLGDRYADTFGETGMSLLRKLSWSFPIVFTVYFSKDKHLDNFQFKCLILAYVVYMLLSGSDMVIRLSMLFQVIGFCYIIPDIVYRKKSIAILYAIFTILFFYSSYNAFNHWDTWSDSNLPYHFFWE